MTKRQDAQYKMSEATILVLLSHKAITDKLPGFQNVFTFIQTTMADIHNLRDEQNKASDGTTKVKKQAREALIAEAMDMVRKLILYAKNTNDTVMLREVSYTESTLIRSTDDNLISICDVIHNIAKAHVASLASYFITDAVIAHLQASIKALSDAMDEERTAMGDKKMNTQKILDDFKILMQAWDDMDVVINIVQTTEADFYQAYDNARVVTETGTRTRELTVQTVDAGTEVYEQNVTLTLSAQPPLEEDVIEKRTKAKGIAYFKTLPQGTYSLVAQKPGFKDAVRTIYVVLSESHVEVMRLEKI